MSNARRTVRFLVEGNCSRTPPVEVRKVLRREVGFGCPVQGCGNPYLEFHHFDPPWAIEQHHDSDRMIAICATHHAQAAAWTVEQIRDMKRVAPDRPEVQGRFTWMRREVIAIVGGNYFHETPNMVVFGSQPMIWFQRDDEGALLLNIRMLTKSEEPRTRLDNNDWFIRGNPVDVESPPSGRRLAVRYDNGDQVEIEFREWATRESLGIKHERALELGDALTFPVVTAEIGMAVGGSNYRFSPTGIQLGGMHMTGCVASRCGAGLVFG